MCVTINWMDYYINITALSLLLPLSFLGVRGKKKCDSNIDRILHTVQFHHDLAFNLRDIIMI